MSKTAAKPNPFGNLTARTINDEAPKASEPTKKTEKNTDIAVSQKSISKSESTAETHTKKPASDAVRPDGAAGQAAPLPSPSPVGKTVSLNAGGIHIEANRKNIRSHRGSYSLSDKAYHNLVRLAELTNNSYNEIFNRLLEDIQIDGDAE